MQPQPAIRSAGAYTAPPWACAMIMAMLIKRKNDVKPNLATSRPG